MSTYWTNSVTCVYDGCMATADPSTAQTRAEARKLAETFPPLTDEQRALVRALLR